MMTSDFILDVSEADFEFEVLAYSQNAPVVVDFWAEWCRPCKDLDPLLEKITREAGPVKGGTSEIAFVQDPDGYKIELIQRASTAGMDKF